MKQININGVDYSISFCLIYEDVIEQVKCAIKENKIDWIEFFELLNEEEKKREEGITRHAILFKANDEFLSIYGDVIREYASIDTLIEAAKNARYMEFLAHLGRCVEIYVGKEKQEEYREKIVTAVKEIGSLEEIENFAYDTNGNLSQENMDILFEKVIEGENIELIIAIMSGILSRNYNVSKLTTAFNNLVDEMIEREDEKEVLEFAEKHLSKKEIYEIDEISKSIEKIVNFIIKNNNPKSIYLLATYLKETAYVGLLVQSLIKTNNLDYMYHMALVDDLSSDVKSDLVQAAIATNIPSYMYLFATKVKNISDDDMKHIIVAMDVNKGKTYIGNLIKELTIREQTGEKVSQNVKDFILSIVSVVLADILLEPGKLSDKIAKAVEENNVEELTDLGIITPEDNAKPLVFTNVQAGL